MGNQTHQPGSTVLDAAGCVAIDMICVGCGYNLRAQPVSGKCPECGRAVAETAAGQIPILDNQGRVVTDLPCVSCGYNLRMQPATGLCPECAAPVAEAARGHYLRQSPPRWVRTLAEGALTLVIAFAIGTLGSILIAVSGVVLANIDDDIAALTIPVLLIIVATTTIYLVVAGVWRLTAPDPHARFRKEGWTSRRTARACLLLIAPITVGTPLLQAMYMWSSFARYPTMLFLTVGVLSLVAWVILPLAVLRHLAALMRRIPRAGLVRFATVEFWFGAIAGLLFIGGYIATIVISSWAFTPWAPAAGPNVATLGYAAGPNAPTTFGPNAVNYSDPNLAITTDPNTGVTTITYTTPAGQKVSKPIGTPAGGPFFGVPPRYAGALSVAGLIVSISGLALIGIAIAGLVLLIMAQRALASAAREAEADALLASNATRPDT